MARIRTNGVELHYIRDGAGEPTLLVHGYLFGAEWWRPQIAALRDRFDVVAVDLRGHMASEAPSDQESYDLWNQAEDVHGLIAQLGLAPVHYVGLSLGGMIGMRLALRHPEDIRCLVLLDTSASPEDPEKVERYEAFRQAVEAGQMEAVVEALPPIFLADDFITGHPEAVREWLQRVREGDHGGLVRSGRAIDSRDDISVRLGEVTVPALVIHGTDDVPIPLERGQEIAAAIPGARFETVSGGHQSNVDRPQATSRLIRDFLVEVSAATAARR